jgi:Dyp-type peroxidase family
MVDLGDIQGIVRSGYGHLPVSYSVFLRIENADSARAWLQNTIGKLMTAKHWAVGEQKPPSSAQVAFTASGLAALGLGNDVIEAFPQEFRDDMAGRSLVLGDTGTSAPEFWQIGGNSRTTPHILLLVFAGTKEDLDAVTAGIWNAAAPAAGLLEIFRQYSNRSDTFEPFGFRDGISQPAIEGVTHAAIPGQAIVKRGEFLLGHINEYGQKTPSVNVWSREDTANVLPFSEDGESQKDFGFNGSFLVWRKLAQDVWGFWSFCEEQTKDANGKPNEARKIELASKLIGRWPSGCPLTLSPDRDNPELGADKQLNNNFLFMPTDAKGFGCPVGSHMRRANPRDALFGDTPERSQQLSARHRIMRRGRPYTDIEVGGKRSDGLVFIALNADLQRQFEFIQQTWVNSDKFNGLYDNPDPILNTGNGAMTIQADPVRQQIDGIPRFVSVVGGGYFFLPGMRALRFLAGSKTHA